MPSQRTLVDVTMPLGLPAALISMLLVVLCDLFCIHDQQHNIVTDWRNFGKPTHALQLAVILDDRMHIIIKH